MTCQSDAAFMSCGNNQHPHHFDGPVQNIIRTWPVSSHSTHFFFLLNITTNQKFSKVSRHRTYELQSKHEYMLLIFSSVPSPNLKFDGYTDLFFPPGSPCLLSFPTEHECSIRDYVFSPSYEMLVYRTSQHPQVPSQSPQTFSKSSESVLSSWPITSGWNVTAVTLRPLLVVAHCSTPGT